MSQYYLSTEQGMEMLDATLQNSKMIFHRDYSPVHKIIFKILKSQKSQKKDFITYGKILIHWVH